MSTYTDPFSSSADVPGVLYWCHACQKPIMRPKSLVWAAKEPFHRSCLRREERQARLLNASIIVGVLGFLFLALTAR